MQQIVMDVSGARLILGEAVVDYTRESLDSSVFDLDDNTSYPPIRYDVRNYIVQKAHSLFDVYGAIKEIYIVGSILSFQWRPGSDIDVTVLLDSRSDDLFKEAVGLAVSNADSIVLPSTDHAINYYVVSSEGYDSSRSEGMYDLLSNKWIRGPYNISVQASSYLDSFSRFIEGIDISKAQLHRDIVDFENLMSMPASSLNQLQSIFKANLRSIDEEVKKLVDSYNVVHELRRIEYNTELHPDELIHMHSRGTMPANVVYKLLERYHYIRTLKAIKKVLDQSGGEIDRPREVRNLSRALGGVSESAPLYVNIGHRFSGVTVWWIDGDWDYHEQRDVEADFLHPPGQEDFVAWGRIDPVESEGSIAFGIIASSIYSTDWVRRKQEKVIDIMVNKYSDVKWYIYDNGFSGTIPEFLQYIEDSQESVIINLICEGRDWKQTDWIVMFQRAFQLLEHPIYTFSLLPGSRSIGSHTKGVEDVAFGGRRFHQQDLSIIAHVQVFFSTPSKPFGVEGHVIDVHKGQIGPDIRMQFLEEDWKEAPYRFVKEVYQRISDEDDSGEDEFEYDPEPDPSNELVPVGVLEKLFSGQTETAIDEMISTCSIPGPLRPIGYPRRRKKRKKNGSNTSK